ncbi:MAG TPA: PASTA domain-containing protein [Streptosporangiaceae bacterium]|nr:PASTA domain-containing protein [Streptosporangiaceae bacterium]
MDTTLSPPAGQLLDGRYRVDSRLAQGGMATVYLGRDTRLDRVVALKIAHRDLASDGEFIRRFMTEARAVAQLSSPNVVGVFDQGTAGEINYIVMEYVAGPTLREVLRARGRLTVRESLDVIEGVLKGLATAHRAGIIHRDVKPENVLLGQDGAVKVADFGLARAAVAAASTKTGMIIGTAAYLAPEQVSSSRSDARTDVYAAGVMLFEMLTGQQPHTGESPLAVAYKHVNEIVPAPSTRSPGLSPALDALVAMATSRDPELRPPDAGHFLQAVAEVRRGGSPSPAGRRGQHAAPDETSAMSADPWASLPPGGGPRPGARTVPADESLEDTDLRPAIGYGDSGYGDSNGTMRFGRPEEEAANHTMVVSPGTIVPGFDDPDYDDGYRRRGSRRGWRRGDGEPLLQQLLFSRRLIYVLGALAAVLAAVLLGWYLTSGQQMTVPQVTGFSQGLARKELTSLGLTVRVGAPRHSDDIAAGLVVATDPRHGATIASHGTVTLHLSLGPVKVKVPSVAGEPVAQAISTLKGAGLKVAAPVQTPSDTIPAGVVVSTDPPGGALAPKNRPVTVMVSAGPPLPNFVGAQFSAAQVAAQQGGYQLNQVPDTSNTQPQGTITGQSPAAGTPITAGEVVTVNVSNGPPLVAVPDVTGMKVDHATSVLQAAGFQVQVEQGFGDRVTGYSPTGQAPGGSTISLIVGLAF